MAQLVKIFDCISRYEWNAYRYPSQFIRLKQENWKKLYALWQEQPAEFEKEDEDTSTFQRLFQWSGFFKKEEYVPEEDSFHSLSEMDLRKDFLQKLLSIQLKWATSTVSDVSFIDEHVQDDERLTYFLQRFPDIYLVMFYPLFQIKNATFDAEIIVIGPLGIEIIYIFDEETGATVYVDEERIWTIENNVKKKKVLSPLLTLKRNEHIIKGILQARGIEIPIHKTVLARNHMIVSNHEPYQTRIVGINEYEKWFQEKRNIQSPLKHIQLQALETLLMYCITTSVRRSEWANDEPGTFEDVHED